MHAAASFYDQVATGTPVHVVDTGRPASATAESAASSAMAAPPADEVPPEESLVPGKV